MLDDYKLDKVLDKVKETIGILKFDETKILNDTVNKLSDNNALKMLWY